MSDYIPLEIQSEIIKKLPVKSLLQFRSVSKQWMFFIDNPEFIKTYHINHPNPQHHLLVQYYLDTVRTYTSIIDDNTFPQQKFSLTAPEPLNSLWSPSLLGSVDGLVCFGGWYKDNQMVVLWNPSIRKSVASPIPNQYTHIYFGVCHDTNDPKLVNIKSVGLPSVYWEVQVFTLSSCVWKTVYTGSPFNSGDLMFDHVFIDGIIYWGNNGSFVISFDLISDKFGEVSIPEGYECTRGILVAKVNESLGLLEYYEEGGMSVCGVWMRKDGVNQPFIKIYTIKVEGKVVFMLNVLEFRNNGEVVMEMEDDDSEKSHILVYEPSSGHVNEVGVKGDFVEAKSYMETLLLLNQSNSIIH